MIYDDKVASGLKKFFLCLFFVILVGGNCAGCGDPEPEIRGNSFGNINNYGISAQQGDWIYYRNDDDGHKIYRVRTDGSGREQINNDQSFYINVVGDWVYYSNVDDGFKMYRVRTDGSRREQINNIQSFYINVVGDWIYYTDNFGKIYRVGTDSLFGSGHEKIDDDQQDQSRLLNIVGNWIYYVPFFGEGIYRVGTDGSGREQINDDRSHLINVVGDWIYYSNADDDSDQALLYGKIYKIRTDGSGRKPVQ